MTTAPWLRTAIRTIETYRGSCRCYSTKLPKRTAVEIPPPKLDLRNICDNVESKAQNIAARKTVLPPNAVQRIASLYAEERVVQQEITQARHRRGVLGTSLAQLKDPQEAKAALDEATRMKAQLKELETKQQELVGEIQGLALRIPNDTHPDAPVGPEPNAKVLAEYGPPHKAAETRRDHLAIARQLELVDFEAGAVTTGSSWYYLVNEGALLEMALVNYAYSIAIAHGFKPVTTPDVVRTDIASRCGFQPRDREEDNVSQMYHVSNVLAHNPGSARHHELVLAGTAEIPLGGMFANKQIPLAALPQKVVGLGHAFRAEAGARGADTRGLYRVHQFTKLELFAVTAPDHSNAMMEEFKQLQIKLFENLGLTFRVLDMPTEELGAAAYRKYDIEAWMPGRDAWGEISSTSNCTDYQARRLNIRSKDKISDQNGAENLAFLHTLNGTAVAVPRLIVALLENGACFSDAGELEAISLPKVLQPFWVNGLQRNIIRWH